MHISDFEKERFLLNSQLIPVPWQGLERWGSGQVNTQIGYLQIAGASACSICSVGAYQAVSGASNCKLCKAGMFQTGLGSITANCTPCRPGTYQTGVGMISSLNCTLCFHGSYQSSLGKTAANDCLPCQAGTYQSGIGDLDPWLFVFGAIFAFVARQLLSIALKIYIELTEIRMLLCRFLNLLCLFYWCLSSRNRSFKLPSLWSRHISDWDQYHKCCQLYTLQPRNLSNRTWYDSSDQLYSMRSWLVPVWFRQNSGR